MDEYEMKRRIYGYIKEICHYSQMQVFATSYYQKNYFQMQIDDATGALISLYMDLWKSPEHQRRSHGYHYQANNIESYEQIPQPEPQGSPQEQIPGADQLTEPVSRSFTEQELADFDGSNGKPAYVAVNGIVYDVSSVVRWAGGRHFGLQAGRDLSGQFMGCHQGIIDRLKQLPTVGVLVKGV